MIYWLTGQPGSGKTSIGSWIVASFPNGAIHIDGDDMRNCFQDKNYTKQGRTINVERAQNIAQFLHYKGKTVVVSFVSPYREQREKFKNIMGDNLKEIYVHTTEDRGRNQFHVNDYEEPLENYIDCDTTNCSDYKSFQNLRQYLGL